MIQNRLLLLPLALVLALLSGCYLHRDAASLRVTLAVPALPDTLDPHLVDDYATRYVHAAVFDALTRIDERGEVQPALATEWRPLGPTAWEFKIRQNVRFQNGEELSAHTIAFNVRRMLRPDLHSPIQKDIPTLIRANTRDLHTVVLTTRRPDPILPRRLAALYIVPVEYLQRVGETKFAEQPVGTGPWKVTSFLPGQRLTLEARKGAWRAIPQSRTLNLELMPDPAARVEALATGRVDIALDVPAAQREPLRGQGFYVYEAPVSAARLVILDTTSPDAPLNNVKVRQALNYAVDKDYLLDQIGGAGIPLDGQVVGREANGYSDRVQNTYPFNPAEAERLMAEAGYPNGFPLTIYYTQDPDDRERRELTALAEDLSRIRVRVRLQGTDRTSHLKRRVGGSLTPAFYETLPYYPTLDASAVMESFGLEKTETLSPTYDNDDFDEIYKLTHSEFNQSIRSQALRISMGILADFPPAIYLYQPVRLHAVQRSILDFKPLSDLLFDFDRLRHS
jgi:peptide/nickel transport system substrate-binding protein